MNKGKKLTFYLVMVLVVEIQMEKMTSRGRSPFLFSFHPFFFSKMSMSGGGRSYQTSEIPV